MEAEALAPVQKLVQAVQFHFIKYSICGIISDALRSLRDMAYGTRKVLIFGAIGLVVALIASSSMLVLPNLITGVYGKTGTLSVRVTDAPVPDLKHLNLTITSLEVLNASDGWVSVPIKGGSVYFDLLALVNITRDIAEGELPVGNYTKIRMEISNANATLGDGSTIDLRVPPGHIDIKVGFEIKQGQTTDLLIDITADRVKIASEGKSGRTPNLNPQFKAVVTPPP